MEQEMFNMRFIFFYLFNSLDRISFHVNILGFQHAALITKYTLNQLTAVAVVNDTD